MVLPICRPSPACVLGSAACISSASGTALPQQYHTVQCTAASCPAQERDIVVFEDCRHSAQAARDIETKRLARVDSMRSQVPPAAATAAVHVCTWLWKDHARSTCARASVYARRCAVGHTQRGSFLSGVGAESLLPETISHGLGSLCSAAAIRRADMLFMLAIYATGVRLKEQGLHGRFSPRRSPDSLCPACSSIWQKNSHHQHPRLSCRQTSRSCTRVCRPPT